MNDIKQIYKALKTKDINVWFENNIIGLPVSAGELILKIVDDEIRIDIGGTDLYYTDDFQKDDIDGYFYYPLKNYKSAIRRFLSCKKINNEQYLN